MVEGGDIAPPGLRCKLQSKIVGIVPDLSMHDYLRPLTPDALTRHLRGSLGNHHGHPGPEKTPRIGHGVPRIPSGGSHQMAIPGSHALLTESADTADFVGSRMLEALHLQKDSLTGTFTQRYGFYHGGFAMEIRHHLDIPP
jgi:hypothetical protein